MPAQTPADLHALFRDAFNLGDVETLVTLYEPNATLVVNGEPIIESQDLAVLHADWIVELPLAPIPALSLAAEAPK